MCNKLQLKYNIYGNYKIIMNITSFIGHCVCVFEKKIREYKEINLQRAAGQIIKFVSTKKSIPKLV